LRLSEVEVEMRSRVRGWARSKWDREFEVEVPSWGRVQSEIARSRLSEVEIEVRSRGRGWARSGPNVQLCFVSWPPWNLASSYYITPMLYIQSSPVQIENIQNGYSAGNTLRLRKLEYNPTDKHKIRVFENKVLRKIYGTKRDEMTGEWRILHNEELHGLYDSPDVKIIKSRWLKWTGHVARMGKNEDYILSWLEGRMERDHWKDRDVVGRTILEEIFEN